MDFFQIGPIPANSFSEHYNFYLVCVSYFIAIFASYVALEMTGRLQSESPQLSSKLWWLFGGAFAMGSGIWTMHFIAMLAFLLPAERLVFDIFLTIISLLIAIVISGFALFILRNKNPDKSKMIFGGIILGFGIAAMHYTGMWAMTPLLTIRYQPIPFILSLLIAFVASIFALYLMNASNTITRYQFSLKIISAFVLGTAITGMHFMAMWSAVLIPKPLNSEATLSTFHPGQISFFIIIMTFLMLGCALALSKFKRLIGILHKQNEELLAAKAFLEQKRAELSQANEVLHEWNSNLETLVQQRTKELAEARDQAVEANKERSNFLVAISHEIKGPLHTILNFSELLIKEAEKQQTPAEWKKLLNNIHSNCENLIDLLSDILDLSKIESNKMSTANDIIDLQSFMQEIFEKELITSLQHGTSFFYQYNVDLPEQIISDYKKLKYLLFAIINYVILKSQKNDITLFVFKEDNELLFKIFLKNVLLSKEEIDHFFHHFFQIDLYFKKESHFLHLVLASYYIKMLNGRFYFEAKPNEGTFLTIHIPLIVEN